MATLVLPNISLEIPIWYLIPPTGTRTTHVTTIRLKPISPEEAPPIQEMVETTPAKEVPIAKPVIMAKKTEKRGKKLVTPAIQRKPPIYSICDVIEIGRAHV